MPELYTTTLFSDANLTHYYRFGGNSSDSKGANNGSDSSMSYSSTAPIVYGQYAVFSGSGWIGFGAKIIPLGAKSIGFWVKSNSDTADKIIIDDRDGTSSNSGTSVLINITTGFVEFGASTALGNCFTVDSLIKVTDGSWHFVVCTWDGSTDSGKVIIYIDGSSNNTGTATRAQVTTPTYNAVAGILAFTSGGFMNGNLDELLIFNDALTPSEVQSLYQSSSGGGGFLFNMI